MIWVQCTSKYTHYNTHTVIASKDNYFFLEKLFYFIVRTRPQTENIPKRMNSNHHKTYADAANGLAGVALETLSVPPTATNLAAVTLVAEASARSDIVEKFEFPKKFCRSGMIIGKENQTTTNICNNNVYGVLDNDELKEYGNYPSTWKLDNSSSGKRKMSDTSSESSDTSSVRARKKPKKSPAAASEEVDQDHQHPTT